MKIPFKILISVYFVMIVIMSFGGFLLVDHQYENSIENAKTGAIEENKTLYTYVVIMTETVGSDSAEYSISRFEKQMSDEENLVWIGEFDEISGYVSEETKNKLESENYIYSFAARDEQTFIQVISKYKDKYILHESEITEIIEQREENYRLYKNIIIGISIVFAAVIYYIEKLKEEAQKKEDFINSFIHEIKTPMTSIIGYADLLRTFEFKPEKRREYSNYIYNEGKRVENLSLTLLDLIVIGKNKISMQAVNTEELFEQLKTEVHFLGDKYKIDLQFDYEKGAIQGEKSLLLVAVKNLVDNACKASIEGDIVNVLGRQCGKKYNIIVQDHGCGIAENEIKRICEPFYMVDKSRARKQGGAGIGLALCSKIVEVHQGEMQIESDLKKGTTVTISLKYQKGGSVDEECIQAE